MHYIGIDVSKAKLDFALLDGHGHVVDQAEVPNTDKGVNSLLKRWEREAGVTRNACLACFEPTGHYSNTLLTTLVEGQVPTWVAHPMDIRQSMGLVRGKNDRIDALRIADYAWRHQDKQRKASPTTLAVLELKELLAFRNRLVVDGVKHKVYNSDLNTCVAKPLRKVFKEYSTRRVNDSKAMVKDMDKMITDHIGQNPTMKLQYELLLSIPRVGPVLASHLLAATELFTRMWRGRQLACHAGVAPHEHTSGSSIKGRSRVSHHADKHLKSLAHMAAIGILQSDNELATYYHRKVAEGKHPMSVLNAVRSKILLRVCAVIRDGRPYEDRKASTDQATTVVVIETSTQSTNFATSGQTEAGHAGEQPARDKLDERRASAMGGETKGLPAQARSSLCLKKLNKRLEMS